MNWINQDWEKEADLDQVYAIERQLLIEQEFFEHESNVKRKPAKITYKKDGNKNSTVSIFRNNKKGIQLRHNISAKNGRSRRNRD